MVLQSFSRYWLYSLFDCKTHNLFIQVFFVGENVNGMKKGKASMHKPAVLNCFEVHGSVSFNGTEEATVENVFSQVSQQTRVAVDAISFE